MLQTLRGEGTSRDQIASIMVERMGKQAGEEKQGRKPWTLREFGGQTVWDWLHLLSALAIPVVLAIVGFWFTAQQDTRQQQIEDKRAQQAQKIEDQRARQAQKIENQRAEAERELAEQQAQDEALQAYLDQMSQLMLERNLLEAEQDDPVHTLAQARTSTVILRLDAAHNESVARFLINSGLAESSETSPRLLSGITLSQATLSHAYLPGADLSGASLFKADLSNTDLRGANLREADLSGGADLSEAFLYEANLSDARLFVADLRWSDLAEADLSGAILLEADLSNTDLRGANLREADLKGAKLNGALGITNEELEQQAFSLADATMPDGQKYEDWLKDR